MKPEEQGKQGMTLEERDRWIEERLMQRIPRVKPKLIAVQASGQMVAAIQADPSSLRLSAHNPEIGVTVVERPYREAAVTVLASVLRDAQGAGGVSDYDIYAVLRRDR
jgi:hypothetical protein